MTAPSRQGGTPTATRLAAIGLLAAAVAVALYVAGRVHTVNPAFSLFGRQYVAAVALKALLATVALGLAVLQVLLALWIYRKLPLAGSPPRRVPLAHRVVGFGLFALTLPIAVHCLIAYGVQLTSLRVAVHSLAGCFFYGAFVAKVLLVQTRRLPGWVFRQRAAHWRSSSPFSGTPRRCGTTTATSFRTSRPPGYRRRRPPIAPGCSNGLATTRAGRDSGAAGEA
jgi:Family of unknown function (DUF6529)